MPRRIFDDEDDYTVGWNRGYAIVLDATPTNRKDRQMPNISQLSREKFFKLGVWLAGKAEHIQQMSVTEEQVASMATKDLKFEVTHRNVKRAAKDIGLSQKLFPRRFGSSPMVQVFQRLDALEKELHELKTKLGG